VEEQRAGLKSWCVWLKCLTGCGPLRFVADDPPSPPPWSTLAQRRKRKELSLPGRIHAKRRDALDLLTGASDLQTGLALIYQGAHLAGRGGVLECCLVLVVLGPQLGDKQRLDQRKVAYTSQETRHTWIL
jgi:hypothetical protein